MPPCFWTSMNRSIQPTTPSTSPALAPAPVSAPPMLGSPSAGAVGRAAFISLSLAAGRSFCDDGQPCPCPLAAALQVLVFPLGPADQKAGCLSKHGDQLSQWRAYGRPRGFSIGFDRQSLQRICPLVPEFGKLSYRTVSYSEAVQDGMIADLFGFVLARLSGLGDPYTQPDAAAWIFILEALILVPAFKSPAFAEEEEVRLQIFHDPGTSHDLEFRNGAMGITPYLEIALNEPRTDRLTTIREVIVGPQPNQEEALRAVKQLLARNEIQDVDVKPSSVPLRS